MGSGGAENHHDVVGVVSCFVSIFGCGFILVTALFFSNIRRKVFALRLVSFISVCDLLACFSVVFGTLARDWIDIPFETGNLPCTMQSLGIQYFYLCSFFWTTCFAHSLWYYTRLSSHSSDPSTLKLLLNYEKFYHMICWSIPMVITLIPFYLGCLGASGPWCWIATGHDWERFLFFYFWLWCLMLLSLLMYSHSVIISLGQKRKIKAFMIRATLYLLAFLICWLPGTLQRFVQFDADHGYEWLDFLQRMFSPLQGFFNALIYGLSIPMVTDKYRSLFTRTLSDNEIIRRTRAETGPPRLDPAQLFNFPELGYQKWLTKENENIPGQDRPENRDYDEEVDQPSETQSLLPKPCNSVNL